MQVPVRVVVAIACIFTGLLVLVVVVGLYRDQVDANGMAILLVPIISGLILGGGLRSKAPKPKPEEEGEGDN